MNINIDYGSRIPIYEQIVLEVERLVTLGILKEGEQVPSIRDLACSLGVNPNTIKKAYDLLENKKIIISKSTRGTFISDNVKDAKEAKVNDMILKIKDEIKELENYGLTKTEIFKLLK